MKRSDIECKTIENNLEELNIEAWLDGQRVGHVLCERHNERLQICDLWVEPKKRRQGIGTALLERVLNSADATGVREIRGDVTQDDIETCPGLLQWYESKSPSSNFGAGKR